MISLWNDLPGMICFYISKRDLLRIKTLLEGLDETRIIHDLDNLERFSKIIVDNREIDDILFSKLKGHNVIAIDEGGPYRDEIPYLVDILPLPGRFSAPNIRSVSFLDLPEKKDWEKNNKILVSFGGEDPKALTELFCTYILNKENQFISKIDLVLGPLYKGVEPDPQFCLIKSPASLKEILPHYSGVICSYGLTAFEANYLDIPVLLINPEEYHEELSRISGFTSVGVRVIDSESISSFLENPQTIKPIPMESEDVSLAEYIENLDETYSICPICSSKDNTVISRFKFRTYFHCHNCHMLFMVNFNKKKISYENEYFFNQYENQYGKTYLDDFQHLMELADQRLKNINMKAEISSKILDVGCAYGPFLKKASQLGYKSYGTDISEDAVTYVKEELGYKAIACTFDDFVIPESWGTERFDVLTMWYVIEHFPDLSFILTKVNSLIKMGGIFSFSTPNGSGISSKTDLNNFLQNSPIDHFTIWEPEKSQDILNLFGFKIFKIRITGHHPERFPSILSKSKLGKIILNTLSKIFKLGDTYEIYAQKVREL